MNSLIFGLLNFMNMAILVHGRTLVKFVLIVGKKCHKNLRNLSGPDVNKCLEDIKLTSSLHALTSCAVQLCTKITMIMTQFRALILNQM